VDAFFRAYYPYIIFALNGVALLVGLAITGKLMTRKDCDECRKSCSETNEERTKELAALEQRVARNEDKLDELPTDKDVHGLTLAMAKVAGEVSELSKEMGGKWDVLAERIEGVKESQRATKELTNRLDNFLRNQKA
jgi:hypothetical protein